MTDITEHEDWPRCKICGNMADPSGCIEHSRGCYTQSENGGGVSWVPDQLTGQEPCMPTPPQGLAYRIKPLVWEFHRNQWREEWWTADTANFGILRVGRVFDHDGVEAFVFRYCVDEFYDEGEFPCDSFEHGKQLAEQWRLERLLKELEPV